jgi:acyl-CoA reductase-like NAD-dependent aldehyde dehydrogenase
VEFSGGNSDLEVVAGFGRGKHSRLQTSDDYTGDCGSHRADIRGSGGAAGVLNLILGSGSEAGDEIIGHPAVKAVSFTGSNPVGIRMYEQVSRRGGKCQCEMGGKNPVVVLADADMDLAVENTAQGAFGSTGQRCTAPAGPS